MAINNQCQGWCFRARLTRGCSRGSASAVPFPAGPSGPRVQVTCGDQGCLPIRLATSTCSCPGGQGGVGGHSKTGEQFRSVVALACQGRLENSVLPPPHRCIQFLSIFITPSCTGPASRVGGRSWGGLGIDFGINLKCK